MNIFLLTEALHVYNINFVGDGRVLEEAAYRYVTLGKNKFDKVKSDKNTGNFTS